MTSVSIWFVLQNNSLMSLFMDMPINKNVDMLVKDIYGSKYNNLGGDLVASSFNCINIKEIVLNYLLFKQNVCLFNMF